MLAALDDPNLIRLREFVILESELVLVTELAEAGSLAQLLRRRGKLSAAEVVATISPVAAGLSHAHELGVLHADVSAANILFTAAGQPKLADLGVARLLTSSGDALGTPAYLDPVVAAGGASGTASDVFSLAAVAFHALTGTSPWQLPGQPEASAEQVLSRAASGEITELSARLAGVDAQLASVLVRALDPEPYRRGTAAEFALDVRAALPPAPVVLAGGRLLTKLGRHSVELRTRERAVSLAATAPPTSEGRPAFRSAPATRTTEVSKDRVLADQVLGDRVPADLTHVARPRVRQLVPVDPAVDGRLRRCADRFGGWLRLPAARFGQRRPPVGRPERRSRLLIGGLLAAVLSAALLTGVLLAGWPGHRPASAAAPNRSARPAADPVVLLDALDLRRAQAYAERQPALLRQVYRSADLLTQDTAQLARWVPVGCRLTGLHTSYRQPRVLFEGAGQLRVQVTASLAAGSLNCPGRPSSRTPPVGPVELALTLHSDGAGYRIDAERILG